MRLFVLALLIGFTAELSAQKKNSEYARIDKVALQIPDSLTKNTADMARYFRSRFDGPAEISRAIFIWIASNIQYDAENIFAINFYQNTDEVIAKVLKTRKGVCIHYAELYSAVANRSGLKTYTILGYTKQNGCADYIPHAWCASLIDSSWYLVDPTWGAGYISGNKFIKKPNDFYFKVKPEELIKSHMPFDPLWQFLNYPVTNQEFYEGKTAADTSKPFFNYADTLSRYEQEPTIEKLESSGRRIEQNGIKNSLIHDRLQHNKREIEYYTNKQLVETYNAAVNLYNEGVSGLNEFIDYRNKQFMPRKPDAEIKEMLSVAEKLLNNSIEKLRAIKNPDSKTANSIVQLTKSIEEAMINLNEQRTFVEKYVKTRETARKSLFYE